jgi:hypothetical protein
METIVEGVADIAPDAAPTLPSACDRLPPWAISSHLGVPIAIVLAGRAGEAMNVAGLPMPLVERLVEVANTWMVEQGENEKPA